MVFEKITIDGMLYLIPSTKVKELEEEDKVDKGTEIIQPENVSNEDITVFQYLK